MTREDLQLKLACNHLVSGHRPVPPPALLASLAAGPVAQAQDFYGSGGAVATLEARTAALLGKERGLFVINGVTAQLAALKHHAERSGAGLVALHPSSHIDADERGALDHAARLRSVRLGGPMPFGLRELEGVTERLAAVVVELPLRRAGYLLPSLDELHAISDHCRRRGIALHFDGARLWEAAAGYGMPLDRLAALADSVYVSFYKGLGGLGGAVVVGSAEFVDGLGVWRARFGGQMFTAYPYALAALSGLDIHLAAMPTYVERARALAARLAGRGLINPATPHVNAFQLLLPSTVEGLMTRMRAFARDRGVWLFNVLREGPLAGHVAAEIVIGDGSASHSVEAAAGWIEAFVSG